MILPLHMPMASFDRQTQEAGTHAGAEWVGARLRHHPMTRHLAIRVREEGQAVVLEGQVPTLMDRQWAGSVASHVMGEGGNLDNRLRVLDDLEVPQWMAARLRGRTQMAA